MITIRISALWCCRRDRTAAVLVVGCVLLSPRSGLAQAPAIVDSCPRLVLTYPTDGWRLTVESDGAARINFAALPQTVEVPTGSFALRELLEALRPLVSGERPALRHGTVECVADGNAPPIARWYLGDEAAAATLFDAAWSQAPAPTDPIEREHGELIARMWRDRDSPIAAAARSADDR